MLFAAGLLLLSVTTVQSLSLLLSPMSAIVPPSPALRHHLIMSSSSFSRRQILEEMKLPFTMFVRPIDEQALASDSRSSGAASTLVSQLSEAKASAVVLGLQLDAGAAMQDLLSRASASNSAVLILTADQVCVHEELGIMEKPEDESVARKYFEAYRSTPLLLTVGSVRLTHVPSLTSVEEVFHGTVVFNKASLEEDERLRRSGERKGIIRELIDEGAPLLACAGALMCEHPMMRKHINYIDDDSAVRGLKKSSVLNLFEQMRVKLEKQVSKRPT